MFNLVAEVNAVEEVASELELPIEKPGGSLDPAVIHLPSIIEWSVLASIAVWLIHKSWSHFVQAENVDREADRKLISNLVENLIETNDKLIEDKLENE